MSESASCSTSDFDSEAQLTGRTEESTSPSPPRPLRLSSAPPRDSPVPRLGLNLGKPAPPLAPQATSGKGDEASEQPAALSIDLLSSAVQLCGSQHPQQDLPKARRQLSERLGVPEQCLSFYEVRQLQDDGTPSSSGQHVAVHVSGSGFSLAALDGLVHEVQALQQQLAESQTQCKRQQQQMAGLQQQQQQQEPKQTQGPKVPQLCMDHSTSTTGDGLMDATDIDSPRPASTESTEQSSVSRLPDSFRAPAELARELSGVRDEMQRVRKEKEMLQYAAELHESSTKESSRPVSRQPSDIRALLAGPSVASSITSLALPDHAQHAEASTRPQAPSAAALQEAVQQSMPSVQGGQSLEQLLQDPELKKLPAFLSWMLAAHQHAAARLHSEPLPAEAAREQRGDQP